MGVAIWRTPALSSWLCWFLLSLWQAHLAAAKRLPLRASWSVVLFCRRALWATTWLVKALATYTRKQLWPSDLAASYCDVCTLSWEKREPHWLTTLASPQGSKAMIPAFPSSSPRAVMCCVSPLYTSMTLSWLWGKESFLISSQAWLLGIPFPSLFQVTALAVAKTGDPSSTWWVCRGHISQPLCSWGILPFHVCCRFDSL